MAYRSIFTVTSRDSGEILDVPTISGIPASIQGACWYQGRTIFFSFLVTPSIAWMKTKENKSLPLKSFNFRDQLLHMNTRTSILRLHRRDLRSAIQFQFYLHNSECKWCIKMNTTPIYIHLQSTWLEDNRCISAY